MAAVLRQEPQHRSGEFCRLQRQPSAPDVSVPGSSQGLGCMQAEILSAPLSPDNLSLERRGEWRGQETTMAAPTTGTSLQVHCCDDCYNTGTLPFHGEGIAVTTAPSTATRVLLLPHNYSALPPPSPLLLPLYHSYGALRSYHGRYHGHYSIITT